MEQSTQTTISHERVKKKLGRPKGTGIFTEEENKERARQRTILYYSSNFEKERERKRLEYQAKPYCLKCGCSFLKLYFFQNFHLNN